MDTTNNLTVGGIDVSAYQGHILWKMVAASGLDFVFVRASAGVNIDVKFPANWDTAKQFGLRRGAYSYLYTNQSGKAQADEFLHIVQPCAGDLPPVVDIEAAVAGTTSNQAIAVLEAWIDEVESKTSVVPIIYTGPSFWSDFLKSPMQFAKYPLWIAEYVTDRLPKVPKTWADFTFWQLSQTGHVPGISGNVDLDVLQGTLKDLNNLRIKEKAA